jgi:hypothetical protein
MRLPQIYVALPAAICLSLIINTQVNTRLFEVKFNYPILREVDPYRDNVPFNNNFDLFNRRGHVGRPGRRFGRTFALVGGTYGAAVGHGIHFDVDLTKCNDLSELNSFRFLSGGDLSRIKLYYIWNRQDLYNRSHLQWDMLISKSLYTGFEITSVRDNGKCSLMVNYSIIHVPSYLDDLYLEIVLPARYHRGWSALSWTEASDICRGLDMGLAMLKDDYTWWFSTIALWAHQFFKSKDEAIRMYYIGMKVSSYQPSFA